LVVVVVVVAVVVVVVVVEIIIIIIITVEESRIKDTWVLASGRYKVRNVLKAVEGL